MSRAASEQLMSCRISLNVDEGLVKTKSQSGRPGLRVLERWELKPRGRSATRHARLEVPAQYEGPLLGVARMQLPNIGKSKTGE